MIVLLLLVNVFVLQSGASDLIVEIEDGKVQGIEYFTPYEQPFYSWRGIPFAKPPLGDLRFLAPQKPDPWNGVLNATLNGPACMFSFSFSDDPQPLFGNSEDCLTINVYSPRDPAENHDDLLPVMFWIYGGGFGSGSSDFNFFDPTPFLVENVIVVNFNYRLGVFGFLSTEDHVVSGNAALKDQLLALKWTRANIARFGGDPERITIYGESAGAISVGNHLVSPQSRGLFKAAIMQSGNALSYINGGSPRVTAYSLAQTFDASITNNSHSIDIKTVLQRVSTADLLNASTVYSFAPILEAESKEAFLSEPRYEVIASGRHNIVPVILGFNLEEGLSFLPFRVLVEQTAASLDANPAILVPPMTLRDGVNTLEIGKKIHAAYVGENGNFSDDLATVLNWKSDDLFLRSSHKDVILQSHFAPVYMYQFSFYGTSSKNRQRQLIPGAGNVSHADELVYMFNVTKFDLQTNADFLTRHRLVKLWTNFAKTHNPTPDASSEILQHVIWEPVRPNYVQFLDIGDDLKMKPSRKVELTAFWDQIWETYARHPYDSF